MKSVISEKSFKFSVKIVKFCLDLMSNRKLSPIANQLLRSGTSIGANVRESENASSTPDFINKLNISLKEANETEYWVQLLYETNMINNETFDSLYSDCHELVKILTSIIKTSKKKLNSVEN